MADYVTTQAPAIGMIGYARPTHLDLPCNLGDPAYTSAARRFFGQPHISKGQQGKTMAVNPAFGNRNFSYNWGADAAFAGRKAFCPGHPEDSFTANHAKDFSQVFTGPSNLQDYRATAMPSVHWGLYQVDSRIQRGSQPTDVGENNFSQVARPTSDGRHLSMWSKDVYAEKQAMNLRKYKEVQAKLGY